MTADDAPHEEPFLWNSVEPFGTLWASVEPFRTLWNSLNRSPSMHALTTAPWSPQELFGPLSLAALERDEYRRATAGYAPAAELLFLDEV